MNKEITTGTYRANIKWKNPDKPEEGVNIIQDNKGLFIVQPVPKQNKLYPFKYETANYVIYESEDDKDKKNPNYCKEFTRERKFYGLSWFYHIFKETITVRLKGQKNGVGFKQGQQEETDERF